MLLIHHSTNTYGTWLLGPEDTEHTEQTGGQEAGTHPQWSPDEQDTTSAYNGEYIQSIAKGLLKEVMFELGSQLGKLI